MAFIENIAALLYDALGAPGQVEAVQKALLRLVDARENAELLHDRFVKDRTRYRSRRPIGRRRRLMRSICRQLPTSSCTSAPAHDCEIGNRKNGAS